MRVKVRKFISGIILMCLVALGNDAFADGGFLGGTYTQDITVTPSENPWTVFDVVVIPEGVTLTIEPGTDLNFMINTYIEVRGTLIALGTADNPISCSLKAPTGSNDKWNGFKFIKSKSIIDENQGYVSGSIMQYVDISEATNGLILSDSTVLYASNISITNCGIGINVIENSRILFSESVIEYCSYGVSIKASGYNKIFGCEITHCLFGIMFFSDLDFYSSYNVIENNNLSYNESVALFMSPGNSHIQHNTIKNNTVSYNNIGLHIGNGGEDDNGYNVVSDNQVYNNDFGIKLSQYNDSIKLNLIKDNRVGLMLNAASFNHITNNIVTGNSEWAVALEEGSDTNVIEHNNIYGNHSGIKISTKDNTPSIANTFKFNSVRGNAENSFLILSGPQLSIEYNSITSLSDTASFINRDTSDVPAMNNFWGSADTIQINQMISDIHDYPQFGEVIYKPFLEMSDPSTPICRPANVVKRLINNNVVVNWHQNTEPDLAGYNVVYGVDPQTSINSIADTSIVIQGILLTELIKVSAFDQDADGLRDQFEGHESAYSIAIAGPYAGGNNSICSGDNYFTSASTAIDYLALEWLSDGDGTFADKTSLHTYYVPGNEDKVNRSVNLTLKITTLGGIELFDKMKLDILDYLIVEAGPDTIVTEGTVLQIDKAQAYNYTGLIWSSSGDGQFIQADTIITGYIPGVDDIARGWAILTLQISSGCGDLDDSFRLTIIPGYDISGTVSKDQSPVKGALILAYNKNQSGTRAFASTLSEDGGNFILPNVSEGEYYIYSVPNPSVLQTHIPTYYAESKNWQDGYLMKLEENVYDVDIRLNSVDLNLPEGQCRIDGKIEYEGDIPSDFDLFNREWFGEGTGTPIIPQPGNTYPAANHVILLMNPDLTKVIGWTLSELDGTFSFDKLPYGGYRLWGEKAGYANKVSSVIYLTPDENTANDIQLTVDVEKKLIEAISPFSVSGDGIIYPNPASNNFIINANDFEELMSVEVQLIDQKGMTVLRTTANRSTGGIFGPIDVSALQRGLYFALISSASGIRRTIKITIN